MVTETYCDFCGKKIRAIVGFYQEGDFFEESKNSLRYEFCRTCSKKIKEIIKKGGKRE